MAAIPIGPLGKNLSGQIASLAGRSAPSTKNKGTEENNLPKTMQDP